MPVLRSGRRTVVRIHRPELFGVLLHQYRESAALSQEELAERAGLSRRGISDLERGERRLPHVATVRQLADALKLDDSQRAALLASSRGTLAQGNSDQAPDIAAGRGSVRHNLPLQLTSFIGRQHELQQLLLRSATTRMFPLTGPGGIGKTRLALEVGHALLDRYPVVYVWSS